MLTFLSGSGTVAGRRRSFRQNAAKAANLRGDLAGTTRTSQAVQRDMTSERAQLSQVQQGMAALGARRSIQDVATIKIQMLRSALQLAQQQSELLGSQLETLQKTSADLVACVHDLRTLVAQPHAHKESLARVFLKVCDTALIDRRLTNEVDLLVQEIETASDSTIPEAVKKTFEEVRQKLAALATVN